MANGDSDDYEPDVERVQESARHRIDERTESIEEMLGEVGIFEEAKYPVTSEELAVEYADQEIDLPNETESLGSVFDRIVDERFETAADAREAILHELTGDAAGPAEYNDDRDLRSFEDDTERLE
jgi:hypothetical protein